MAEIAIKKTSNDPTIPENVRWKANDLVVACPDGHPWTARERQHFTIVKMPGVTVQKAREWVGPKVNDMGEAGQQVLQRSRCTYDETNKKIVDKDDPRNESFVEDIVGDHGDYALLEAKYKVGRRDSRGLPIGGR